jgi:SulP family sulfate permease
MGMMNLPEMRRLARVQRFDFWVAIAAIAGTLVFGVLAGVVIGITLSLLWLVYVATHPDLPLLALEADTQVFREHSEHPEDEPVAGVIAIRMDGGLFFATSDALEDRLRDLIHTTPGVTGIVLDCEGIDFVDSQGAAKMGDVLDLSRDAGLTLRLARLKPAVRATLDRDGVLERVGHGNIHGNVYRAVQAQLVTTAVLPD